MSRVLHTADVHLTPEYPERLDALRACLDLAESEDVDAVTIGGDLFDGPEDAEALRPTLRNDVFADQSVPVVVIPGNHDGDVFERDVFFGEACTILTDDPYATWTDPNASIRVTGIPFRSRPDDDLLVALGNRDEFAGAEILLVHCSLDAPFADRETGDESATQYFPIARETLADLGFDYHLAGHYHSQHHLELSDGSSFTYPGTPASTRSSETGRRRAAIVDTDRGTLDFHPLETFRYERERFRVTPGEEDDVLGHIQNWTTEHAVERADATVRVEGWTERDEKTFYDQLVDAAGAATLVDETRTVQAVLSHPLFEDFEAELAERDWDQETREAVWERTVDVFARLSARGDLY